jgi:CheY-like chemotaxis protein
MPEMDGFEATRKIRECEASLVKCEASGTGKDVKREVLSVKRISSLPDRQAGPDSDASRFIFPSSR